MKKFLILLIVGVFFQMQVRGQTCTVLDPENTANPQNAIAPPWNCGESLNYAPDPDFLQHTPVKKIRMVWHFMCDDDGNNNFNNININDLNYNKQSDYMGRVLLSMNGTLANLQELNRTDPNFPTPHIPNANIEYTINQSDIFYHDNTVHMNEPVTTGRQSVLLDHYNYYVRDELGGPMPYKADALHIFFYPNIWGTGTNWAYKPGNLVAQNGDFVLFNDPDNGSLNPFHIFTAKSILHETLHSFGLSHTNRNPNPATCNAAYNDGCDDTPASQSLNPCPCWNGNANDGLPCNNNIMEENAIRNALSRCQLGKMHYNLIHNPSVYPYLIEDFCDYDPSETITINTGENITWQSTRYLKGDLIVESGAELTVKCIVGMPAGGKVVVKAGGKLTVDGGSFTNVCDATWAGIRVEGNSSFNQTTTSNQGYLILKNDAIIEHAYIAVSASGLNSTGGIDWSKTGGIIIGSSAIFKNNLRDLEFLSYHVYGGNNFEMNNLSHFKGCSFITDDENRHSSLLGEAHVVGSPKNSTVWK